MKKLVVLKEGLWLLDLSEVTSLIMDGGQKHIFVVFKNSVETEQYYKYSSDCENDFKTIVDGLMSLNAEQQL